MKKSWIVWAIAALIVIGVLALAFKLISGALGLLSGALDTLLGIALILGLVVLVAWMFRYAAKKRK